MTRPQEIADRLFTQQLTDPSVNSLRKDQVAHYIRAEADNLCLDPWTILQEVDRLVPMVNEVQRASDLHQSPAY